MMAHFELLYDDFSISFWSLRAASREDSSISRRRLRHCLLSRHSGQSSSTDIKRPLSTNIIFGMAFFTSVCISVASWGRSIGRALWHKSKRYPTASIRFCRRTALEQNELSFPIYNLGTLIYREVMRLWRGDSTPPSYLQYPAFDEDAMKY